MTDSKRPVPMRVLSLGLSRTGTVSMCKALEILLDAPVYHGHMINDNRDDCAKWHAAMDAKHVTATKFDWDSLLGNYTGVTDMPSVHFWRELIEAYPDAKVVLVQRDYASWLKSWKIIVKVFCDWRSQLVAWSCPNSTVGMAVNLNYRLAYVRGARNEEEVMAKARAFYDDHYADIRREVPGLLEYKLGSGWGPLCEFLEKDIPEVPFPWENDAESMRATIADMRKETFRKTMKKLGWASVVVFVGLGLWWMR